MRYRESHRGQGEDTTPMPIVFHMPGTALRALRALSQDNTVK